MLFLKEMPRDEALRILKAGFPGLDPVEVEASLVLLCASKEVLEAHEAQIADHGISRGRFSVLMLLKHMPGYTASPTLIARTLGVTKATMTGLLDGLERDGFIKRNHSKTDRRKISVELTRKGFKYLEKIIPNHVKKVTSLVKGLSKAEMRILIDLLDKLRNSLPRKERK